MSYLYEDYKKLNLNVFKYENLIEIHGDNRQQAIICAHADRHGLISLGDNEFVYAAQYMKEIKYGEINKNSQKKVKDIARCFEGEHIYAYNPDTGEKLTTGYIDVCYPNMRNDDALFLVQGTSQLEINIPLAYARKTRFEDGYLKGQIDNAISLAVIYTLFKAGYQGSALLTTEEEIGKSWLHIASYLEESYIETDKILVLDTSPYFDKNIIDAGNIILRNRDKTEQFNLQLLENIKERCLSLNLPFRIKDEDLQETGASIEELGSTELGRLIQGTEGHYDGITIQIPTIMYHTSNEMTSEIAIKNYYALLEDILIKNPLDITYGNSAL